MRTLIIHLMLLAPLLRMIVARRETSALAIGAALGYQGNSAVSEWMRGERPVPIARLEPLADELKVEGVEREQFILYGILDHCPEIVAQRFLITERRLATAEHQLRDSERELGEIRQVLLQAQSELADAHEQLARLLQTKHARVAEPGRTFDQGLPPPLDPQA